MSFGCVFALYLLLSPGQLRDNVSGYGHTCVVEIERRLWGPNEGYFTGRCETCRRSVSFDMQSVLLEDSPRLVSVSTLHPTPNTHSQDPWWTSSTPRCRCLAGKPEMGPW